MESEVSTRVRTTEAGLGGRLRNPSLVKVLNYQETNNLLSLSLQIFLLRLFSTRGFIPSCVRKGSRLLLLTIEELELRFLATNNYLEGNEYQLAKHFGLQYTESYFPLKFLKPENFNYCGETPEFIFYLDDFETDTTKQQKLSYYRLISMKNWNFKKELLMHVTQRLDLVQQAVILFLKEVYMFQTLIQLESNEINLGYLHPLNAPICTLSGFIYRVFKYNYLNYIDMFIVKDENGAKLRNISRLEHKYASYLDFACPEKQFIFQKYFREAVPDLFSPVDGLAVWINGCHWHSHMAPECTINKGKGPQSLNFQGKTFASINEEFNNKMTRLMANNPIITQIDIIWECQIHQKMVSDLNFATFLKSSYICAPLERLIPRKCYRGSYIDTYQLRWSQNGSPNERFYHLDINGLYSYVSIKNPFMIGKYEVLIGRSLSRLKIEQNQFYVDNVRVMGSVQLSIIPPIDCLFPFLMYRSQNNQSFNTLCKLCCEHSRQKCNHNDSQRALTGCYMISEIEYALTLNYVIVNVYECHVYKQYDFILRDFVKILTSLKTKYSMTTSSDEDCKYLNEKMELSGLLELKPNECTFNSSKRMFYKLAQNSFFGKFGQRSDFTRTLFLSDQSQVDGLLNGGDKIHDVFLVNPNLCIAEVERNLRLMPPNRNVNIYISSQITAFSRQIIHEYLLKVSQIADSKLISVDCDSIMFALPNSIPCPLIISNAVGDFKNEINGNVLSFFSFGPKNYVLTYENNGNVNVIRKISGLSLAHCSDLNAELYELFLNNYAKNLFLLNLLLRKNQRLNF